MTGSLRLCYKGKASDYQPQTLAATPLCPIDSRFALRNLVLWSSLAGMKTDSKVTITIAVCGTFTIARGLAMLSLQQR